MITRAEIERVLAAGRALDVHRSSADLRRGVRRAVVLAVVLAVVGAVLVAVIATRALPVLEALGCGLLGAAVAVAVDLAVEIRSRLRVLHRVGSCPVCVLDWHALRAAEARMWWCGGTSSESHAADRIDDVRMLGGA